MTGNGRMSSRARLIMGCQCDRPLLQRDEDEVSCVKCGHGITPKVNTAKPPKRTGRHGRKRR